MNGSFYSMGSFGKRTVQESGQLIEIVSASVDSGALLPMTDEGLLRQEQLTTKGSCSEQRVPTFHEKSARAKECQAKQEMLPFNYRRLCKRDRRAGGFPRIEYSIDLGLAPPEQCRGREGSVSRK